MQILRIILTVIYVIDCIALTTVVLMQEGKQKGLGVIGGGNSSDTYWGQNNSQDLQCFYLLIMTLSILAQEDCFFKYDFYAMQKGFS